ncbi:MAG: HAD-IA family hydrolase [Pseudomonadota bacterium]
MTPALVIFDCDGVLVNSEPITNREMAKDLTAHGLSVTTEQCIELFVGGTIASVADRARELGADLPPDWVTSFYDRMCATLGEEVEAIPGVHDAIAAVEAAGIATAIGSNGPMRKMEVTLARTGLMERFRGRIFSAHDVGVAKPDPGLYLHVAASVGHSPETTTVVEDSVSGVRAAVGAGMRCLGFACDTPAERLAAAGAEPFGVMADLPRLLGLK